MRIEFLKKMMRFLPIWVLPALAWMLPLPAPKQAPDKVNLALRRTGDALLRLSGDTLSRIPAAKQLAEQVWQLRLNQSFAYDHLPELLQQSFDEYGIHRPYTVAVRHCDNDLIDLGYHSLDLLVNNGEGVPCRGRAMPEGCHYLEVSFLDGQAWLPVWGMKLLLVLGLYGLVLAWWMLQQRKNRLNTPGAIDPTAWLSFGRSQLDVSGQVLACGGMRSSLTFREAKLLRLLVENQNQLLSREHILAQVWADEGVLVGRSLDVFVSRLRKKLAIDPSVSIVAVHGVGYRLEVGESR